MTAEATRIRTAGSGETAAVKITVQGTRDRSGNNDRYTKLAGAAATIMTVWAPWNAVAIETIETMDNRGHSDRRETRESCGHNDRQVTRDDCGYNDRRVLVTTVAAGTACGGGTAACTRTVPEPLWYNV